MEIKRATEDGIVVLEPIGHLDTRTSPEFERVVLETLKEGHQLVIMDLGQLSYVSSAGVRVMLIAAKRLSGPGAQLAMVALTDAVSEVLDVAGLMPLFRLFPTREEARNAMKRDTTVANVANRASSALGGSSAARGHHVAVAAAIAEQASALMSTHPGESGALDAEPRPQPRTPAAVTPPPAKPIAPPAAKPVEPPAAQPTAQPPAQPEGTVMLDLGAYRAFAAEEKKRNPPPAAEVQPEGTVMLDLRTVPPPAPRPAKPTPQPEQPPQPEGTVMLDLRTMPPPSATPRPAKAAPQPQPIAKPQPAQPQRTALPSEPEPRRPEPAAPQPADASPWREAATATGRALVNSLQRAWRALRRLFLG